MDVLGGGGDNTTMNDIMNAACSRGGSGRKGTVSRDSDCLGGLNN